VPADEVGTVASQMWNLNRSADRCHPSNVVVRGFGRILAGQRKRARIERGVVDGDAEVAVVEATSKLTVVAERRRESERRAGAVVVAAVDQKPFVRALAHFFARLGRRRFVRGLLRCASSGLRLWSGFCRGVQIGAL